MRLTLLLGLAFTLLSQHALSHDTSALNREAGVWTGTLGEREITACFNLKSDLYTYTGGAYYFNDELKLNHLLWGDENPLQKNEWRERTHVWQLESITSDMIQGVVSSESIAPLQLRRITAPNDDHAPSCSSDEFNIALETPPSPSYGPIIQEGKISYRAVMWEIDFALSMQIIELMGSNPAYIPINEWIRKHAFIEDMFDCRRTTLATFGTTAERGMATEVTVIIGTWLDVKAHGASMCGLDGISVWNEHSLWNLETGIQDNLLLWFKGPEEEFNIEERDFEHDTPLRLLHYATARLTPTGILFEEPQERNGSGGSTRLFTFKQLSPYLSKLGKANIRKIRSSTLSAQK